MASRETGNSVETYTLNTEELALLEEGHMHWSDHDKFSQEKVDQVKGIFKKVFNLPEETALMGFTIGNAIVLQSVEDRNLLYYMIRPDHTENEIQQSTGRIAWKAKELYFSGACEWIPDIPPVA